MTNKEIADVFEEIAELLEIKGESIFRIRAHQKVSLVISTFPTSIVDIYKEKGKNSLMEIPCIGKGIADKIEELINTNGRLKELDDLKREIPEDLLELMKIPGLGPKKVKLFYDKLKIKTINDLENAIKKGKLKGLPGMGEKSEKNLLKGIEIRNRIKGRISIGEALPIAKLIVYKLKTLKEVERINYAGSLRRGKETIRDIDILITSENPKKVMEFFTQMDIVKGVISHGPTKSSVLTKENIQVDLRVVEQGSYGASMQYFTGSKEHNVKLRERAIKMGLKINEYGVFRNKDNKKIYGISEEDVYKSLGLNFIPPELRENKGEIEASEKNKLPRLININDIRGDLHVHTKWTDGTNTISEVVEFAQKKGYEYIAITDHSESLKMVHGLTPQKLLKHTEEIRIVNNKIKNIRLLAGSEVDIKPDGGLDYSNDVLRELDFVVASIHSHFNLDKESMTNRIVKAINNKYVNVIGHPTGKSFGEREAYDIDLELILEECRKTKTMLELNSNPSRLDLNDINLKMAKEKGVKIVISTDTHNEEQMELMNFGIITARRGWLEKVDVANTLSFIDFMKLLKQKR